MSQKISVSLEQKHIRAIERYGKKIGVAAFSTALQALIHKFEQTELLDKQDETAKPTNIPETVAG